LALSDLMNAHIAPLDGRSRSTLGLFPFSFILTYSWLLSADIMARIDYGELRVSILVTAFIVRQLNLFGCEKRRDRIMKTLVCPKNASTPLAPNYPSHHDLFSLLLISPRYFW